jgi:L-cysteine/cystine lyase
MPGYPELAVACDTVYLNTGAAGPMPRRAHEVILREAELEFRHGRVQLGGKKKFLDALSRLRALSAALIGARPVDVAVTGSTSEGVNLVLWGLPLRAGDHILSTTFEHLGALAGLSTLCKAKGIEASFYEPRRDEFDIEAFFALATDRTRVILISHVSWTSGRVIPIQAICRRARDLGIFVLVDGAQSAGAIPVDVRALGADFYAYPAQKWLLGAEGVGFLYVAPERLDELQQTFAGFFSFRQHDGRLTYSPQEGSARFEMGTRFRCLLDACAASLEWLGAEVGWETVLRDTRANAGRFGRLLAEWTGISPVVAEGGSGLVSFELPERVSAVDLVSALEAKRIYVRTVPGRNRLRVSTGFFNTEEDFARLLDEVRAAIG